MKFNYIIIVLLLIIVKVLSQDITKCQATTEKYSNCVSSFHAESFETKCETFSSALCQQLFKSPKTILKDCDEEFIEITSAVLKDMNNILQYTCYKDEEGEYCPLSKIIQETEIHPDIYEKQKFSEIFENIKESCSSERCLKISISYMESIKSMLDDDQSEEKEDIQTLISYLNKCPKDNNDNNSENSNNKSGNDTHTGNNVKNNNNNININSNNSNNNNSNNNGNDNGNSNSEVNKSKNSSNSKSNNSSKDNNSSKNNNSSKVINISNNSNSVNGNSKTSSDVNNNNSNSVNKNDISSNNKGNSEFDPSNISEVLSNNDESDSTVLITALDHNQNDQFGSLNDGDGDGAGAGAGDVVTNNAVDPTNALNNDGYINDDIGIKTSLENTTYNNTISENNINVVPDQSGSPQRIILSYSFSIILLSLILYI
jgi:hypothetical protein